MLWARDPQVGDGDGLVQSYNFRLCVTQNKTNMVPFSKPQAYNSSTWELARRCCSSANVLLVLLTFSLTPRPTISLATTLCCAPTPTPTPTPTLQAVQGTPAANNKAAIREPWAVTQWQIRHEQRWSNFDRRDWCLHPLANSFP